MYDFFMYDFFVYDFFVYDTLYVSPVPWRLLLQSRFLDLIFDLIHPSTSTTSTTTTTIVYYYY